MLDTLSWLVHAVQGIALSGTLQQLQLHVVLSREASVLQQPRVVPLHTRAIVLLILCLLGYRGTETLLSIKTLLWVL
jgi:hypothetical protein